MRSRSTITGTITSTRIHGDHEEKDRSPAEHGEGSVAHRDLAANAPAPGVPEVLEALLAWAAPPLSFPDERPTDRQPRTIRARAPPTVAA